MSPALSMMMLMVMCMLSISNGQILQPFDYSMCKILCQHTEGCSCTRFNKLYLRCTIQSLCPKDQDRRKQVERCGIRLCKPSEICLATRTREDQRIVEAAYDEQPISATALTVVTSAMMTTPTPPSPTATTTARKKHIAESSQTALTLSQTTAITITTANPGIPSRLPATLVPSNVVTQSVDVTSDPCPHLNIEQIGVKFQDNKWEQADNCQIKSGGQNIGLHKASICYSSIKKPFQIGVNFQDHEWEQVDNCQLKSGGQNIGFYKGGQCDSSIKKPFRQFSLKSVFSVQFKTLKKDRLQIHFYLCHFDFRKRGLSDKATMCPSFILSKDNIGTFEVSLLQQYKTKRVKVCTAILTPVSKITAVVDTSKGTTHFFINTQPVKTLKLKIKSNKTVWIGIYIQFPNRYGFSIKSVLLPKKELCRMFNEASTCIN